MDAAASLVAYRAAFAARGAKLVCLRRWSGKGNSRIALISTPVQAVITGLAEEALVGNIREGERLVLMIVADVAAANVEQADPDLEPVAWPAPISRGDEVILADGTVLKVESVDMETRSMGGVSIAYQLQVSG